MPELITAFGAMAAGASVGAAVLAVGSRVDGVDAASWLARRRTVRPASDRESRHRWTTALKVAGGRERLVSILDRAGWEKSPERVAAYGIAVIGCSTVFALAAASMMSAGSAAATGALGFVLGIGVCSFVLMSAVATRRRRLAGELVPLLELFTLELNGGGSALSALESVTGRIQCELAADIRRMLISAQVGSIPFESRLLHYSEQLEIPALGSLATMLASSREYGTGVGHGVRALARDLREAQRRELIVHSRRALNHVLIPAAVGVLLPFLGVVMFPAVSALQRNFH